MYYSNFPETTCNPQADIKFYDNNKMTPQKRNYNRKIRGRNQAVNQEAKSPVKRPSAKKPAQFDLNETFISFTPKKRLQKEARQFIDRLNSNINVFHHNIPESPEVTPITCLESPQSSYHKMPESFPSFILPPVIPRVELTRSSTPSSEGQNYSSFFRENFEVEDMFMYAEWKKDIESTYFVYNHNERRRSSPEAVNDTLVGNTSPKNFPQFTHVDPQAYYPKQVPKLTPTVYIRHFYYPLYTPPHRMPQVHQMHPNIMEVNNPFTYMNAQMPQPSEFVPGNTHPYFPVVMKQYTQYQYSSAPRMHQPLPQVQPTVIEEHQFIPVPSPYPGAVPNYFY